MHHEVAQVDHREIRERMVRSVRRLCPPDLRPRTEDIVRSALLRLLRAGASG